MNTKDIALHSQMWRIAGGLLAVTMLSGFSGSASADTRFDYDRSGDLINQALITVVAPPVLGAAPPYLIAQSGGAFGLSMPMPQGVGLSYQWLRNGAAIAGATNDSLLIADPAALAAALTNLTPYSSTRDRLGAITAQGEYVAGQEIAVNAFDGNPATKWLDHATNTSTRESWIQYRYAAGQQWVITQYAITSANDAWMRDPSDWRLLGSNDGGTNWATLDIRTNQSFAGRYTRLSFTFVNTVGYNAYRLQIDRVAVPPGADSVQLAEIELLGLPAEPILANVGDFQLVVSNSAGVVTSAVVNVSLDTDHDGLPDVWEANYFGNLVQNGFGDTDGDGVSNYDEYLEGTGPNDANSLLPRLTVTSTRGGTVTVTPAKARYQLGEVVQLAAVPNAGQLFLGWFGSITNSNAAVSLTLDRSKTISAQFGIPLADALDTTNLVWTTGGNTRWFGQTTKYYSGGYDAAEAGFLRNNEETWLQTTITTTNRAEVSFAWSVAAESSAGNLAFFTNGIQASSINDVTAWQVQKHYLPPGTHELKWVYSKHSADWQGNPLFQDAAWLDQVVVTSYYPSPDEFNPGVSSPVYSLALQADNKVLLGGYFSTLGGQPRNSLGRLNADGTLASEFNPGANSTVLSLAVQPDGRILVGGEFTKLGGQTRNYLGRLTADGTLDGAFNPGANRYVFSQVVQADGKILVGGGFTTLGGQTRNRLGRLNADGTLDSEFNPGADSSVHSLAVQADGKILVGGDFYTLGGQPRDCLGRLNADGSLDSEFNPGANNNRGPSEVVSLAVQADGKILVGGRFTTLGGRPRNYLGRLNADGSLDSGFNPGADSSVYSLAVQADGKILVGGYFKMLGGQTRNYLGRLNNTLPATQSLACDGSAVTWLRGGTSPEVWRTTFELSRDGSIWTALGAGTRIPGGWQLTGLALPSGSTIRARGFVAGGYFSGSGWFVETNLVVPAPVPVMQALRSGMGSESGNFGLGLSGPPGLLVVVEASTNLTTWQPIQTNALITGNVIIFDPESAVLPKRFYRARFASASSSQLVVRANDGTIRSVSSEFGFPVAGTAGQTVIIEASGNLRDWAPVATNSLLTGLFYFNDPQSHSLPARFYRARLGP